MRTPGLSGARSLPRWRWPLHGAQVEIADPQICGVLFAIIDIAAVIASYVIVIVTVVVVVVAAALNSGILEFLLELLELSSSLLDFTLGACRFLLKLRMFVYAREEVR